jgi:biopolymer transport protein ExbD
VTPRRGFTSTQTYAPNLASMVDVVMVILIFFMLGTSVNVSEGVLPTELPSQLGPGGGSQVQVVPAVQIVLMEYDQPPGCKIVVMERELVDNSFAALSAFLKERREAGADPNGRILIGAEPSVAYQCVISTMDACVRAGFGNIQFAVNPNVKIDAN